MNRLRELREQSGFSLDWVSRFTNIPNSSLSEYEKGFRQPKKKEIWETLADFFDVSVPYIMGLEETNENMVTIPKAEYERLVSFEKSILKQVDTHSKRGD